MPLTSIDPTIFSALYVDPVASPLAEWLAESIASWGIGAVPVVLAALWLSGDRGTRLTSVASAMASFLALMMAGILSWLLYEPRPFAEGLAPNVLHHVADSSFPSDHAALMAAVAFGLLFGRRRGAAIVLFAATASVGWARVALGVHYPSDIAAGLALGFLAALLFRTSLLSRLSAFTAQIAEALAGRLRYDALPGRLHHSDNKER
jgi:undecaprenyl-diphosphatase